MRRSGKLAAAAAVTAAVVAGTPGVAMAASGGYGPTPPSNGSPGGFTVVVASKIIGPGGGTVTASVPGAAASVTVPAGAFPTRRDVVITAPDLGQTNSALANLGFSGYQAVAGLGVAVEDLSGAKFTGTFAHPLSVELSGPSLGAPGEQVLQLNGPSSARVVSATLAAERVAVQVSADPDLVAINANGGAPAAAPTVAGATSQHTGLPFRGEEDLAGVLAVLGAAALAAAARRRRS